MKQIKFADLVNDQLESELRKVIRQILKHHKNVDGVLTADLVSGIKPIIEIYVMKEKS